MASRRRSAGLRPVRRAPVVARAAAAALGPEPGARASVLSALAPPAADLGTPGRALEPVALQTPRSTRGAQRSVCLSNGGAMTRSSRINRLAARGGAAAGRALRRGAGLARGLTDRVLRRAPGRDVAPSVGRIQFGD